VADVDNELVGPVREFLDRAFTSDRRLAMLEANGVDAKLWDEAAQQGWFALLAPEDEDGLALQPAELVPVFRLFGERLLAGPMLEQMLLPGLLLGAVPAEAPGQTRPRLRAALSGESRIAVADPGVTAHWQQENGALHIDSGRLTGSLELVRFGAEADEILVVAHDGDEPVVALLSARQPGVTVTERPSADPGARFARIAFDVPLEAGDVLARGDAAARLVVQLQAWTRLLIAAELAGIARHLLDLALGYIQQREQFGRAIATFQAVRHLAASAARQVILLENFCEAVAADSASLSPDDLAMAAMTVKANASEAARSAAEDSLQMHGGIGFTYEYELHWYYKRVLSLRTWYGDERELAIEIGRRKLSA
jgi:alkylation response protein AidB-like acyl-CoA dehydrogenase